MAQDASRLLAELFAIYAGAKLFGTLFERAGQPGVLGEVLAGIVLGPSVVGVLAPSPTSFALAQLGAVFLLFSAGLETRPRELLRVGGMAMSVAAAGVAAPFLLGFGYMRLTGHSHSEAVFLAAALVATSVGITARLLSDLGVLETRAARIILAAAVFDDILGLLLLAVVAGSDPAAGTRWTHIGLVFAEALAFALFMLLLAPRILRRCRGVLERGKPANLPLVLALACCLGCAALAERIGMAAIVGAFFAGLALGELAPRWKLRAPVGGLAQFLAPFFFFTMGARLDLGIISGDVLLTAIVVTALAVLGKLLGCGLPLVGEGWRTALQVGVGMVPRGEVGLIVALAGLEIGRLSQDSYAAVIFMAAATTLLAPPFLKPLFKQPAAAVPSSSLEECAPR